MKQNIVNVPEGLIAPLTLNGLDGRVLKVPSLKSKYAKQHILMIYGHHSSLERMYGIVENISEYGNVTMPDLPGFGGMNSFDNIGKKPDLDNFADYLATFIKLHYRNKKISIVGMSFGFVIVTRMLQKYPELTSKINLLVSLVGFSTTDDFKFKKRNIYMLRATSLIFGTKILAPVFRSVALNSLMISSFYRISSKKHVKMKDADANELKKRIKFEIYLWHCNDVRTYMQLTAKMMNLNLTDKKVNHDLLHITVGVDQYFNTKTVKKNLNKIFNRVTILKANLGNHAPTVIGDAKSSKEYIPKELRNMLAKI